MDVPASRRGLLRRALFQVHLWTGLAVALYAIAISVSGSILVYAPMLGARAHVEWRGVPKESVEGRPVVTTAQAVALVRQALPGRTLLNVQVPAEPWHAHVVGLLDAREYRVVFVHPTTGAVSPPVMGRGAFIGWLDRLHSNFFSARPGRVANGIGGLLLVLLSLTGIVIWWPGRGRVRRALRVEWGAGWKRVVFDLHNALGAWLLVPVIVLSITGAYFTWPQVYRDLVGRASPLTRRTAPRSTPPASPGPALDLDVLVARVRAAEPGRPYVRVDLPGGARAPYVLVASAEPEAPAREATTTFIDQYGGHVLEVRRGSGAVTRGDAMVEWIGPLHTGHFGGPVVQLVWAVLGLAPTLLAVTGTLMWWNRVIVPRRRQASRRTQA
ncbi:hypothetical protein TBR22_A39780 [Luteitalea sp. TBR-22]|uniref:PepSY-associated TM helix domain-containing protein n=1 Tax=Luteitalea sp. TBR-22 TaxID=2802971 RepID=UPI001AFA1570|nr:PepSY-associated TM helix domain-containing protein [Luteitalea sp. TBR-22]BCS34752.1 hypothetical protein TBR22_A39780 [Luteitalea sp. TBR-22]